MLTRRTNVLLSEIDYLTLSRLAADKGKTMGELIRQAIEKTYKISKKKDSVARALNRINQLGKKVNTKNIDYKELINYGRKY